MSATDLIKSQVSVYMLMQYYGFRSISQSNGDSYRSCCGLHNGNNNTAFVTNNSHLWYCHTGDCGGGDIFDLVCIKERIGFIESVQFIANLFNIDISNLEIIVRANVIAQDTKQWIEKMRSMCVVKVDKVFDISTLGELYPINSYRNFNNVTLKHFNATFCTNNKRIVVPIRNGDELVGATMRDTTNTHPIKWLHQPTGLKIHNYLYNYNYICNTTILTEGVFDVFNLWQNGYESVASFGCHLAKEQENMILTKSYELLLAYDNDKAGRNGTRNAIERLKDKINIRIAKIPINKDMGQLDSKELMCAIQSPYNIKEWSEVYGVRTER